MVYRSATEALLSRRRSVLTLIPTLGLSRHFCLSLPDVVTTFNALVTQHDDSRPAARTPLVSACLDFQNSGEAYHILVQFDSRGSKFNLTLLEEVMSAWNDRCVDIMDYTDNSSITGPTALATIDECTS
jgi:hypothetical protein